MRYPWIFLTILGIWIAIGLLIAKELRLDPTTLYFMGVAITTAIAIIGFKST